MNSTPLASDSESRAKIIRAVLFSAIVLFILARTIHSLSRVWEFSTDDAFITLRYAQHLAQGHGLVWNSGEAALEGFSNLSYVLLGALAMTLELPPMLVLKLTSTGSLVLTCGLLYWLARRWLRPIPALLPALLLTAEKGMLWWTVSGLETAFFQLLIVLCVTCAFYGMGFTTAAPSNSSWSTPSPRPLTPNIALLCAGFLAFLAAITRPEGPVLVLGVGLGLTVQTWISKSSKQELHMRDALPLLAFLGAFAVCYLPYFFWHLSTFGRVFPNTVYCKSGYSHSPFKLLTDYWGIASLYLLLALFHRFDRIDGRVVMLWSMPALYALLLIGVDPIIGHYGRHFLGAHALLLVASSVGAVTMVTTVFREKSLLFHDFILMFVALCLLSIPHSSNLKHLENKAESYQQRIALRTEVGLWLREHTEQGQAYSIGDAGLIPFLTPGPVIDVLCLNSAEMTRPPISGDRHAFTDFVYQQAPQYLVLTSSSSKSYKARNSHGVDHRLANDPRFTTLYQPRKTFTAKKGSFHYYIYQRRDP